jgi:hypothetical protein
VSLWPALRSQRFALAFTVVTALTVATVGTQQLPPPFPRTNATLLFQNSRINVYDIVWPKGQPTALHRHVYDQVGTYYVRGGRTITTPDGQARSAMTEIGALSTTRKGTTHIEEGNTDPPLQAVFIELKDEKPSGFAPAAVGPSPFPRDGATQVFDDERVTVWDVQWGSGAAGFSYRAAREAVIVWLGNTRVQTATSGAAAAGSVTDVKPGSMRHLDRGAAGQIEVVGPTVRALIFELK